MDRLLTSRARSAVTAHMPEVNALLQRSLSTADARVLELTSAADRIVEGFRRPARATRDRQNAISTHSRALAGNMKQAVARAR